MSNRLDPDQAQRYAGPDLGPNCLQLSADDISRLRVKAWNPASVNEGICIFF